jgi:ABC-type transport system involved in cytochrome c biogenesis permease subunit
VSKIQFFCFTASYAVALALELLNQFWPRPVLRLLSLVFGGAGLVAHTLYLADKRPPLAWQYGWMLFLAWILAIFYLYGSIHHGKVAWGIFVLPLVLGLVSLGRAFGQPDDQTGRGGLNFWGALHGQLLLLAAVGVCVGFLASLMYLIQMHRLRTKAPPGKGLRLLSLERLEAMNRRAINLSFPLLTVGVLIGAVLLAQTPWNGWTDPRVLLTGVLWLTFAVMFYLRYGYHLRGRQLALLTIVAFVLLLGCLTISHPAMEQGGGR